MQLGMIGLGRMGANMVRRLTKAGHQCVAFDRNAESVRQVAQDGTIAATSLDDLVKKLKRPRAVWLMVPAAVVDATLHELAAKLDAGDIVIDGGNSYYIDDIRRAKELTSKGLHYVDVGTSGGVWGLERGYCQMIGGETQVVEHLDPIFKSLAPGRGDIARTPGREKVPGTAEEGYLHCGRIGRWAFREDGAQRDRVRVDGGLCGRAQHPQACQRRQRNPGSGCRNHTAAQSGKLPVRLPTRGCSRGVETGQRGGQLAARLDGDFPARTAVPRDAFPDESRIPGRGAGRFLRLSNRRHPHPF